MGIKMKFKNFLVVVEDIEKSKKFYEDLFGLKLIKDNDGNMILTEKLALQQKSYWEKFLNKGVITKSNSEEIYQIDKSIMEIANGTFNKL